MKLQSSLKEFDNMLHQIDNEFMVKTYLYLPEELNNQITLLAKDKNLSKAEFIRRLLNKAIEKEELSKERGTKALRDIIELGKKSDINPEGITDASVNHDKYLWEEWDEH